METQAPDVTVIEAPEGPEEETNVNVNITDFGTPSEPSEPPSDIAPGDSIGVLTNIQMQLAEGERRNWETQTTSTLEKIAAGLESLTGLLSARLADPEKTEATPDPAPSPTGALTVETTNPPEPRKPSRKRRLAW